MANGADVDGPAVSPETERKAGYDQDLRWTNCTPPVRTSDGSVTYPVVNAFNGCPRTGSRSYFTVSDPLVQAAVSIIRGLPLSTSHCRRVDVASFGLATGTDDASRTAWSFTTS